LLRINQANQIEAMAIKDGGVTNNHHSSALLPTGGSS